MRMKKSCYLLIGMVMITLAANSQTWTHTISTGDDNQQAFLWVPSSASTGIRGLILAAQTAAEEAFSTDPAIRSVASKEQLAIIYFNPAGFSNFGNPDTNPAIIAKDTLLLKSVLKKLAQNSGFSEIEHAPWLTFGHSTSSAFARNVVWWKPERSFGAIVFKGGAIYKPRWTDKSLQNVPLLAINGQREEYGPNGGCNPPFYEAQHRAVRDSLIKLRLSKPEGHLVNLIVPPGEGHFSWTSKVADFTAKFIQQAAKAKIPRDAVAKTGPVSLIHLDEKQGWLSDTALMEPLNSASISSFSDYTRQKQYAFWHFNKEMVEAWLNFHKDGFGKILQDDITFKNADYESCGMFYNLKDVIISDSGEFTVEATSNINPEKIKYRLVGGPAIHLGENRFKIDWTKLGYMDRVRLVAYKEAYIDYLYGERAVRLKVKKKTAGLSQQITMAEIPDQIIGSKLHLKPLASSGLPVNVSVFSGPAEYDELTQTLQLKNFRYGGFPFDTASVMIQLFQPGNAVYAASDIVKRIVKVTGEGLHSIITDSLINTVLCRGCTYHIPFRTIGNFSSQNMFIAQLSDRNGDFKKAVNIGSYKGPKSGSLKVKIPRSLTAGSGYRIRVLSTKPIARILESKSIFTISNNYSHKR